MGNVIENVMMVCQEMGTVELSGIKLEDANRDLLDVTIGSLDEHVAMQPAAMAYFGSLKKETKRRLDALQRQYDRWERQRYAAAKAAVESGTAAKSYIKVEDVKSRFCIDNAEEIEKWEARIQEAQAQYDTMDVWFEAWRQKSFSLREHVSITEDERYNTSTSISDSPQTEARPTPGRTVRKQRRGETNSDGIKRVKELMRKRREEKQTEAQ